MILEIVLGVSVALNAGLGFATKRLLDRTTALEGIFEGIHGVLMEFSARCEDMLNTPAYANEPVVTNLLTSVKDLYEKLQVVNEQYQFNVQLNNENAPLEKTDAQ